MLGTGEQAGNVGAMLGNNDRRSRQRGCQDIVYWSTPSLANVEHIYNRGQSRSGDHGRERHIAEGDYQSRKDSYHYEHCLRYQSGERSQSGGHSFSAAKFQPDREYMPQDGEQCGQSWKYMPGAVVSEGSETSDKESDTHCGIAFGCIKNEGGDSQCRGTARHVCRADIAAAALTHIV